MILIDMCVYTGYIDKSEFVKFVRQKITNIPPLNNTNTNVTSSDNGINSSNNTIEGQIRVISNIDSGEASGDEVDADHNGTKKDLQDIIDFVDTYKEKKRLVSLSSGQYNKDGNVSPSLSLSLFLKHTLIRIHIYAHIFKQYDRCLFKTSNRRGLHKEA